MRVFVFGALLLQTIDAQDTDPLATTNVSAGASKSSRPAPLLIPNPNAPTESEVLNSIIAEVPGAEPDTDIDTDTAPEDLGNPGFDVSTLPRGSEDIIVKPSPKQDKAPGVFGGNIPAGPAVSFVGTDFNWPKSKAKTKAANRARPKEPKHKVPAIDALDASSGAATTSEAEAEAVGKAQSPDATDLKVSSGAVTDPDAEVNGDERLGQGAVQTSPDAITLKAASGAPTVPDAEVQGDESLENGPVLPPKQNGIPTGDAGFVNQPATEGPQPESAVATRPPKPASPVDAAGAFAAKAAPGSTIDDQEDTAEECPSWCTEDDTRNRIDEHPVLPDFEDEGSELPVDQDDKTSTSESAFNFEMFDFDGFGDSAPKGSEAPTDDSTDKSELENVPARRLRWQKPRPSSKGGHATFQFPSKDERKQKQCGKNVPRWLYASTPISERPCRPSCPASCYETSGASILRIPARHSISATSRSSRPTRVPSDVSALAHAGYKNASEPPAYHKASMRPGFRNTSEPAGFHKASVPTGYYNATAPAGYSNASAFASNFNASAPISLDANFTGSSLAAICPTTCNPSPYFNKCDVSSSCTTTGGARTYCACPAGMKSSQWNSKDFTKQFKVPSQPYVYVAPGVVCDRVCGDQTCTEVLLRAVCA